MAAPASPLTQLNSPAQLPRAKSRRPTAEDTDRYQDRYRLHVVATNIADVVTSLGGLIFDRAMAGWDVTVAVDGSVNDPAIRILGGRVAAAGPDCPRAHVLAVATDVFVTNEPGATAGAGGAQGDCDRGPPLGPPPAAESELHVRPGPAPAERGRAGLQIPCPGRSGNLSRGADRRGLLLDGLTPGHPGLWAVTNCNERWVCCSTSTRPAELNRSTNACRSNMRSPITRAPAVIARRTGADCPA